MISRNLVDSASLLPESLRLPDAWVGHLPFAAWIVRELKPEIFVELGTHSGNSYFSFCQSVKAAALKTKCWAVDTWQGDEHSGSYGDEIFAAVDEQNRQRYSSFSRLMRMTFDEAVEFFSDGSVGLLHIDGLHTYEAVRHDFEIWLPRLAPGAVVLLHDTNVREQGFGVWKFWEELKRRYPHHIDFTHSHGLGVIQIDGNEGSPALTRLQPDFEGKTEFREFFAALGARQLEYFELLRVRTQNQELTRLVAECDGRNDVLTEAVAERDEKIRWLYRTVNDRDEQLQALQHLATEKNNQLVEKNNQLDAVYRSKAWRLMRPLRGSRQVI